MAITTFLTVTEYSHHFTVSKMNGEGKSWTLEFARRFIAWGFEKEAGRMVRVMKNVYASAMDDRSIIRFHINALNEFKLLLRDKQIPDGSPIIEWIKVPDYEPTDAKLVLQDHIKARENQQVYIDYFTAQEPKIKLTELQTGLGKGIVTMIALRNRGKRFAVVVKPMYMDKWVKELCEVFKDFEDRVLFLAGSASIMALIAMAKEGKLDADAFVISNATYRNWISEYEERGEEAVEKYGCAPDELFELLGVGCRVIDECHQDFHFCFKLDTYTHVPSSISLSATLINQDPFITKMYNLCFPKEWRLAPPPLKKYVDSHAVHFYYKNPKAIRSKEYGSNNYSHNAVEESIMKNYSIKDGYYKLINTVLEKGYFSDYKPGEKAVVYASTVKMCTDFTNYLAKKYPKLDVRRYVSEDPFANVIEPDIRVTTIGSAGAAVDIPGLKCTILTTAIQSIQANIQVLGRLRERNDGPTRFYFLVASNHEKQMIYYAQKKEMLHQRAATFRDVFSGYNI